MSEVKSKKCNRCGEVKPVSEFHKMCTATSGFRPECKICRKKGTSQQIVLEQNKRYYKENKGKEDSRCKLYRIENKDKIKKKQSEYCQNNKKLISIRRKKYMAINKKKINKKTYLYRKEKKKNDIQYKVAMKIRSRVFNAIKRQSVVKAVSTIVLLGCTTEEARKHLESQFLEGMSWGNHGIHGWHIDHIKPCASFDLTDVEQQKECFNFNNMQPLWAFDNLSKGAKYE